MKKINLKALREIVDANARHETLNITKDIGVITYQLPALLDALEEAHKIIDRLDPEHCDAWIDQNAAEAAVSWLARFTDEETK